MADGVHPRAEYLSSPTTKAETQNRIKMVDAGKMPVKGQTLKPNINEFGIAELIASEDLAERNLLVDI